MNDGLKIEYLPVGSLKPYEKNEINGINGNQKKEL